MKVYSVLKHVDYEGCDILGVFGSREEAMSFAKSHEHFGKYRDTEFGVVESELGQEIDFYEMVDWVE